MVLLLAGALTQVLKPVARFLAPAPDPRVTHAARAPSSSPARLREAREMVSAAQARLAARLAALSQAIGRLEAAALVDLREGREHAASETLVRWAELEQASRLLVALARELGDEETRLAALTRRVAADTEVRGLQRDLAAIEGAAERAREQAASALAAVVGEREEPGPRAGAGEAAAGRARDAAETQRRARIRIHELRIRLGARQGPTPGPESEAWYAD